ncbi:uncharacterized protein LOC119597538 [Penaeus monodon]|uniref:uncharacterized protein LOC119597538 n=1 Tax=Penaeus monodon TaxID=6687 RepID=UPI0018A73AF6|nr:uncharacterized protein LOC119597538 [Penaeus monodon]
MMTFRGMSVCVVCVAVMLTLTSTVQAGLKYKEKPGSCPLFPVAPPHLDGLLRVDCLEDNHDSAASAVTPQRDTTGSCQCHGNAGNQRNNQIYFTFSVCNFFVFILIRISIYAVKQSVLLTVNCHTFSPWYVYIY